MVRRRASQSRPLLQAGKLFVWTLLALAGATVLAAARTGLDRLDVAHLRQGLAAFDRQDYTAAGALLRRPAEHGAAEAQAALCYLHNYGRGVPQSFRAAAHWCRRAAAQGDAQGQYLLGLLYSSGHGVPEDYVQAYKWLNLAATRTAGPKRDFSYRIRDSVAAKMSPAQVARAQALSVAWRPQPELRDAAGMAHECAGGNPCREP